MKPKFSRDFPRFAFVSFCYVFLWFFILARVATLHSGQDYFYNWRFLTKGAQFHVILKYFDVTDQRAPATYAELEHLHDCRLWYPKLTDEKKASICKATTVPVEARSDK